MKALVIKSIGDIAVADVADPVIEHPQDAIVKITTAAICGTDLHIVRGTMPFYKKDTVLGHEGVGIVEKIGSDVKDFKVGDRVLIPSTIACGACEYCKKKLYSQCDNANPEGPNAGTAFYGSPITTGSINGMQAEKVRVLYADPSLIKVPNNLTDEQVILLSDILPTSYMAVENIDPQVDDTVAVFGCGPVGQLAILCLKQFGIKKIFAIDRFKDRLAMAEKQGAHPINFDETDPVKELKKLTNDKGPTKIIDAVGIDAERPQTFMSSLKNFIGHPDFSKEVSQVAPQAYPQDGNWKPGNAPSQVLRWAAEVIAKAGTISLIGVYTELLETFPIGEAFEKNVIIRMGNCNHRAYFPMLLDWVETGKVDLLPFISHRVHLNDIVNAYKHFDKRDEGWIKVIVACRY